MAWSKSLSDEKCVKVMMPCPRVFLQAIEGLVKFANIAGFKRVREALQLSHIDILLKYTVEESISNMKLFERLMLRDSYSKDKTNSGREEIIGL